MVNTFLDGSKIMFHGRCLCHFIHWLFGGWAKTVLPVSFPGTMSDVDNVEHMQPIDGFRHIRRPRKMKCKPLAWHFIIAL